MVFAAVKPENACVSTLSQGFCQVKQLYLVEKHWRNWFLVMIVTMTIILTVGIPKAVSNLMCPGWNNPCQSTMSRVIKY
eukprot:8780303-Ditylum_brightwellii.AAC.1